MHNQQLHFGFEGMTALARLFDGTSEGDDHIAQVTAARFGVGLIGREGKHIRWGIVGEEIPVERLDAGILNQHNGHIGIRAGGKVKHGPGGAFQQLFGEGLI
jgi:hypothetical protein